MEPRFEEVLPDYGCALVCPTCGGNNLHHYRVDTFDRNEDAPNGLHARITGGRVAINHDITGNPSTRRDGLIVRFWCESGCPDSMLTIAQHKGTTFVAMKPEDVDPAESVQRGDGLSTKRPLDVSANPTTRIRFISGAGYVERTMR
jgi:hypothetical protein